MSLKYMVDAIDGEHELEVETIEQLVEHVGRDVAGGGVSFDGVVFGVKGVDDAARDALLKYRNMGNAHKFATDKMVDLLQQGRIDIAKVWLDKNLTAMDLTDYRLHEAISAVGDESMMMTMLDNDAVPKVEKSMMLSSIAFNLVERDHLAALEKLLATTEVKNYLSGRALQAAIYNNKPGVVKSLLEDGTDPYQDKPPHKHNLIAESLRLGYDDITAMLVASSAKVSQDPHAFARALQTGNDDVMKAMVAKGFSPVAHGAVLLAESLNTDSALSLKTLKDYGVDYRNDENALATLAVSGNRQDVIDLMQADGVDFSSVPQDAVERGMARTQNPEALLHKLQQGGVGVNAEDLQSKLPEMKRF